MIPTQADIENRKNAVDTATMLLDSGCVCFDDAHPFRVGQGLSSPLHVDIRPLLGFPDRRNRLLDHALEMVEREAEGRVDAIACCTEGPGVPVAAMLADRLGLPLVFVRRAESDPRKHRVEGRVNRGWRVLLVEQLATDGHRKAGLVQPLRDVGANVTDLLVVFQYGVFDTIHEHLAPLGIRLHALSTWWDLLEAAEDRNELPQEALSSIRRFLSDPTHWTA